ncbi:MAG: SUMF1/EgtB/PvdO family nonheme iron enzyme [Roseibacillus sp.]|jgi:formylglycine-generating enzyme required for sulfatase activity|nr:SUMF1/EgtB/PvdO family nonheme iron enzyme [Roseibacillus sp.]MDP7306968.1 SUMF1/EgtB/PvdO family nonheme iron enzyme [Roseibacillus sp.]HJM63978.1 SUMF1/EgtB/PvdO family nonheme iron enzyme [Roseibacillus sp.]|tara:strand:- start:2370 stop:5102 length:2733 start_codon:yes stop_codon:yes gene_type:complete
MIWSALKNNLVISLSALCFSLAFLSSCGKKETPSTETPSSKEETTSGSPKSSTSSNKPVSEPAAEEPVPVEPKAPKEATGNESDTPSADEPATVPVQDPDNAADFTGFGAVSYSYRIGKYEVTNAEFCAFLNAAAKRNSHDLYDDRMAGEYGGIIRSGTPGDYRYATRTGCGKKPVGYVTWETCVRYCNWLSNGQGEGDTGKGPYRIEGGSIALPDHSTLARGKTTRWVLASENEWYKAAYYDPAKGESGGYWPYACKGGSAPACNLNSNEIQEVGVFAVATAYGTFDQNGNLWEYNEHRTGNKVGLRGGSFFIDDNDSYLRSTTRYDVLSAKWPNYGFRVVALGTGKSQASSPPPVPEPEPRSSRSKARTFYISSSEGDDELDGGSATVRGGSGPWKSLARASVEYIPGDTILLKRGDTWDDELRPAGSGTPDNPITISAYGEGPRPVIDRQDFRKDLVGIRLTDQGGFRIAGIEFNRCLTGIYADYPDDCPTREFIWIEDCYFHDSLLYQHYEDYPRRKIGLGICFFSYERDNRIVLKDITIKDCIFRRLASGVWTNSPDNFNKNASYIYNFADMNFEGCLFEEGFQWQQGIRGVAGGSMRHCVTHDIGRGFRSFNGVAGSMFFRCKDWVFEDCEWGFVSIGLGSGDGESFDFEGNCDDMTMRNCLFHDTDGPGFLLCCYASDGHAHTGILMENCVINGKSKRPIGLPRCAIVNTTDWNESTWEECRFYISRGEALMRVMDPEKEKRTKFVDCLVTDLSAACSTPNLALGAKASSKTTGPSAGKANDGDPETAWTGGAGTGEWLQLVFPRTQTVNEIRLREAPTSSITRYQIQYADPATGTWKSCFNGMKIGEDFIAPIVPRKTRGLRLHVMTTDKGKPSLREFEVYRGTGRIFNDPNGAQAIQVMGQ